MHIEPGILSGAKIAAAKTAKAKEKHYQGFLLRLANFRVLDPACGTMHFGLVAFDLLAEMYREELEKAGQPGWPEKPSVTSAEAIPGAIIAVSYPHLTLPTISSV